MGQQCLPHFPGIFHPLLGQVCICLVGIFLTGCSRTGKIGMPRFDVQIEQIEHDAMAQVAKRAIVDGDPLAGIDHLDVIQFRFLHRLEMGDLGSHPGEIMLDSVLLIPTDVIRAGDLDAPNILFNDLLVITSTFYEEGLGIVLGKFLGQAPPAGGQRVDCIIDGHLTLFVIEEEVDVVAAFLENLLPHEYRGRAGINMKIVLGHILAGANVRSPVIPQMEDLRLHAQPPQIPCQGNAQVRLASSRQTNGHDHDATRMKQAAGFGAVELRRSKLTIFGHVVNGIDICAGPSPLAGVPGCNVGGAGALCKSAIDFIAGGFLV